MRCPVKLEGEAKAFWDANQLRLEKEGVLSNNSLHSFLVLCQLWQVIRTTDPTDPKSLLRWTSSVKQYNAYAKEFGLLPWSAKKAGLKKEESLLDRINEMMKQGGDDAK